MIVLLDVSHKMIIINIHINCTLNNLHIIIRNSRTGPFLTNINKFHEAKKNIFYIVILYHNHFENTTTVDL